MTDSNLQIIIQIYKISLDVAICKPFACSL